MTAAPSWETCPLAGVRIFTPGVVKDDRGCFVKTFHEDWFAAQGIAFAMREEFVSVSRKGVIRVSSS